MITDLNRINFLEQEGVLTREQIDRALCDGEGLPICPRAFEGERHRYEGRPVLIAITQAPDGEIGFSVPASNDDIIRAHESDLVYELERLWSVLRWHKYPFSFLRETEPYEPREKCAGCGKPIPKDAGGVCSTECQEAVQSEGER